MPKMRAVQVLRPKAANDHERSIGTETAQHGSHGIAIRYGREDHLGTAQITELRRGVLRLAVDVMPGAHRVALERGTYGINDADDLVVPSLVSVSLWQVPQALDFDPHLSGSGIGYFEFHDFERLPRDP
jgi:hypothetical protein